MRARRIYLGLVVIGLGFACKVSNEDHCVHRAVDSDAWCAEAVPGKPFCSPCAAADHGCVAAAPTPKQCPDYAPDSASDGGTDTDTDTD